MKNTLTVMKFTMKDMLSKKAFIISTIIILLLIVLGCNVPRIVKAIAGEHEDDVLLIVDKDNVFEGELEALEKVKSDYKIIVEDHSFDEIKEKIENSEIESALIIENEKEDSLKIRYIVEDTTMMEEVPEDIVNLITTGYANKKISELGLTQKQLEAMNPDFEFSLEQTKEERASGNVLVIMLISIVLFYAIYFAAYQVSSSITTEKTSKIIETLVTSTSPKSIVLGKTLGIGIIGLVQLCLIVATAVISAKLFMDPELISQAFDLSNITPFLAVITVVYFLLGYLTFALLYALTGSTVSKPEDVQSANGPVAILAVVGFYLSYFSMFNPTSDINALAAILPISSPFCMPFRIMMGLADAKEIAVSIILLIVTIIVVAKVAIKIYSNAILNYGMKFNLKDLKKMYKAK